MELSLCIATISYFSNKSSFWSHVFGTFQPKICQCVPVPASLNYQWNPHQCKCQGPPELMNELVKGADETHQSLTGLFIWKPLKAMHQESGWNAKVSGLFYRTMHSSFICISRKEWTKKRIGLYVWLIHSLFLAINFGILGNKWTESCPIIIPVYFLD